MFGTEQDQQPDPSGQEQTPSVTVESQPTETGVQADPWAAIGAHENPEPQNGEQPAPQTATGEGQQAEPPAAHEEGFEDLDMAQVTPRAQDRIRHLVNQNKQANHVAQQYQQLAHGLGQDEVQQALEVARLIKTDPQKALEMLSPVFGNVALEAGAVLPQDLQEAVHNGQITEEYAKQLAQGRSQTTRYERQQKEAQQQQQQERIQATQREFSDIGNNLEREFAADPDYQAIRPYFESQMTNALRGISEQVAAGQRQPITAQELEQMTRQTYDTVKSGLTRFKGAPAARNPVTTSSPATGNAPTQAKSLAEAQTQAWDKFL